MKNFRDLKVWEKSYLLTLSVYKAKITFPKDGMGNATLKVHNIIIDPKAES